MIIHNDKEYKIVIGMATMNSRDPKPTINSLNNQTISYDELYIYNNDHNNYNATDNGKFYYFDDIYDNEDNIIFFSVDDDLIYHNTYIEYTINQIFKHNCIITYHSRTIINKPNNYYINDYCKYLPYSKENNQIVIVDIAGTGVTAFCTDYFKPYFIFNSEYKRMSDLIFSQEAMKNSKIIIHPEHHQNLITSNQHDLQNSCYYTELNNNIQTELANNIYLLKNNTIVYILSYDRKQMLNDVINTIPTTYDIKILDDGSDFNCKGMIKFNHTGKLGFYEKFQYIYDDVLNNSYDNIIIMQDDMLIKDLSFIQDIKENTIIKLYRDYRTKCWIDIEDKYYNEKYLQSFFTECSFATTKKTFLSMDRIAKELIIQTSTSSGVGQFYSHQAVNKDILILAPVKSFIYHGDHPSKMHPEERLKNPLISK
jgi:hypothetical protein